MEFLFIMEMYIESRFLFVSILQLWTIYLPEITYNMDFFLTENFILLIQWHTLNFVIKNVNFYLLGICRECKLLYMRSLPRM